MKIFSVSNMVNKSVIIKSFAEQLFKKQNTKENNSLFYILSCLFHAIQETVMKPHNTLDVYIYLSIWLAFYLMYLPPFCSKCQISKKIVLDACFCVCVYHIIKVSDTVYRIFQTYFKIVDFLLSRFIYLYLNFILIKRVISYLPLLCNTSVGGSQPFPSPA